MKVYTYSEARQRLSRLLDEAKATGETRIKRQDGTEFTITPVSTSGSPFDVSGVKTEATTKDILSAIRDSREREYGT